MTKTQPEYVPRRYLSVSTLVRFSRCPRLYFFEKSGLRPAEPAIAPFYGSCMHEAVPVALETEDVNLAMEAFLNGWEAFEADLDEKGDEDKKRNRRCAERSLKHFIHTHKGTRSLYKLSPPPEGLLPVDDKTSRYEVPWAIDIGLDVPLVGRFDAFCNHRDTGKPWIWELKTTSRLNAAFFDAHEMYTQNLTYKMVGQTILDEPVEGVMLEGMLVNDKKVDNMTQPLPITQHHLDANLAWLRRTGQQLLDAEKSYAYALNAGDSPPEDAFPQNFNMCTPYTHFYMAGYRCDFAHLCRVPDWSSLTMLYRVEPDHDFLQVTVDSDATRKVEQTK